MFKAVSAEWRALSPEERARYRLEAANDTGPKLGDSIQTVGTWDKMRKRLWNNMKHTVISSSWASC